MTEIIRYMLGDPMILQLLLIALIKCAAISVIETTFLIYIDVLFARLLAAK